MISKKIMLTILVFHLSFAYDPTKITESDLKLLKQFDKLAYEITTLDQEKNIKESLYQKASICIKKDSWLDKVKIYAKINAKTPSESENAFSAGVTLQYNIFDLKEAKNAKYDYIQKKQKIFDLINSYLLTKESIRQIKLEIKYYLLKEVRLKARQKSGIINLDERLKNLEKIMQLKEKLQNQRIELLNIKQKINAICPIIRN